MSHLDLVCLSLTTNLRCVGFTVGQFAALIIPPALEVIISLLFIYLYSGPARWAQVLLAADGILYFTWALLDMLSRVVPAARTSLPLFGGLDYFVGAVSFTPILFYSTYLYRLTLQYFVPPLPRKFHPYLEISLPVLLVIAITVNEVSSFAGTFVATAFNSRLVVVEFPDNSESLWFSLSRSSLTIYTVLQFIFFLLAFSRFSRAFQDQRRIELTHSDEQHYFNGIVWITVGIFLGVVETIAGFARVSFGVALGRRIIHSIARTILMFGLLKGLDVAENFENLTDELRGMSRISKRISHLLRVNPERSLFRRLSQSSEPSHATEKENREQRVTVHYERGQAPFLQIRFSVLDLPAPATLADTVQQRQRSLSGLIPSYVGAGTSTQLYEEKVDSDARNVFEMRRAKSLMTPGHDHHATPDWMQPPERIRVRQDSGGTVSDSLSIVRDLERRFPNLPPRVTGKYRGSILGENYEEDRFPVVGVSRQSSLRHDGGTQNPSEEGGVTLSSSGSIKRKPAPPLLDIACISDRRKRPTSTWGGLTSGSPATPTTPRRATTLYNLGSAQAGEPSTPRSRRATARNVIRTASRALSDASIRSAEWLASSRSPKTALTPTEIEMYRRGAMGPGSARITSGAGETLPGEDRLPRASRRSVDDITLHARPSQARHSVGM